MISLLVAAASAGAMSITPIADVVGADDVGVRPGLRVGYEPIPEAALELVGDYGLSGWDAGLAVSGRAWFIGHGVEGLYGLGRLTVGMSGTDAALGPWTGFSLGFGGRPISWLDIQASAGPDWAGVDGMRWRTELALGFVIPTGGPKGRAGKGNVWHRPKKIR